MNNTNIELMPRLISATIEDHYIIQNMARFYVYDITRHCGFMSPNWACPANGLYECVDFEKYFVENDHYPFLVKIDEELAGFILVNKIGLERVTEWNIDEFYIVAKFQGTGVAAHVFKQVLDKFSGQWEVSAIPENTPAVKFWRKVINNHTKGDYSEQKKLLEDKSERIVFTFNNTKNIISL